jgi:hypothetical protein
VQDDAGGVDDAAQARLRQPRQPLGGRVRQFLLAEQRAAAARRLPGGVDRLPRSRDREVVRRSTEGRPRRLSALFSGSVSASI